MLPPCVLSFWFTSRVLLAWAMTLLVLATAALPPLLLLAPSGRRRRKVYPTHLVLLRDGRVCHAILCGQAGGSAAAG